MNKQSLSAVRFFCGVALATLFAAALPLSGQPQEKNRQQDAKQEHTGKKVVGKQDSTSQPAFRIDQPGTITFTVGMVIKGKIEKPQVIIFLPKEKTYYRDVKFTHSFADEIGEPLPFIPILE
jgi:hypothetical protein